ncbi:MULTISPECIES: biopolymer transporter ExbD [unclassified Campylobacter]|uniref:biopolymer transporter ExbD n=1 Tax=unclassified Campylobacter TaxID=2593542 RepID=UPI001BDA5DF7|nr:MULTISPECIES: biopolymer transporter ExbD [unclassified Campylobacter]MBZ7976289.1 biopolymer transporter ExbD [Campylobacter sp. RM12637]MBZ7977702.1 biopolymer transporter ExbD [Campylobacter sp. RM12654]MBZ7979634.1 biopolymer transporter ExbD [Campylobacter sp. RM12642]MBZ7981564.1 biopolymer transporter ExbD [Campylobacter sp. RM12640]MBZ7983713.1 biopolymer transporter ExbD [Campylobacter sp. RM12647]MBZ7988461.1 biopolymer transporter ExbD [Campylobacter sp. RM12635]MBZ7991378.1 bi
MKNDFLHEDPELNITPLVDVMLVLLVILMLVIPNLKYDENINLPNGSKSSVSKAKKDDIFVSITKDEVVLNKKKYPYIAFFDNFSLIKNQFDKDKIVYISGDKDISYDKLMQVLSTFSKAGFVKISLQTK